MCEICRSIEARVGKRGYPNIADLASRVWKGELSVGMVDAEFATWLWPQFLGGFTAHFEALPSLVDSAVLKTSLINNMRKGVAAKTYQFIATLSDFAGSGDTRLSWDEFKPVAARLNKEWNVRYLAAEVDLVEKSVQSVNEWYRFKETAKALPNLKYLTVGDDRVRPEHMALDEIIRPIDDAFWDLYFPPNGYGCRCDVSQTDAAVTPAGTFDLPEIRPEFMNNPGKSGQIFTQAHPYFRAMPGEDKQRLEQFFNLPLAA